MSNMPIRLCDKTRQGIRMYLSPEHFRPVPFLGNFGT